MNCISDWRIRMNTHRNAVLPGRYQCLFILALSWFTACGAPASDSSANDAGSKYQIEYSVRPDPEAGLVEVEMRLQQTAKLLRELQFRFDPQRISGFDGDGDISIEGSRARWNPPDDGGSLRWQVRPAHQRGNNGYDAWLDARWGLFRAEDIIPRAATRTRKGATSETRWTFELPHDWSVVTQYSGRDGHYSINNPERRFDQPSGWMVMGRLGVRRDTIAGVRVAIAGPVDNAVRRLDMLALLNWTLPELASLLPAMPRRLTIISAGDPMWRGGLSAPQSLYIHADRPLISENGTSTLLHELVHIVLGLKAGKGHDWIVEGIAEYYGLELLRRSGSLSAKRSKRAKSAIAKWAESAPTLCGDPSTGARTALAVTVLTALDEEIRSKTDGAASLDSVVAELVAIDDTIDLNTLRTITTSRLADSAETLQVKNLPGCRSMAATIDQT